MDTGTGSPSVVVVGRSGFIARGLGSVAAAGGWRFASHDRPDALEGAECVVNCALPPAERTGDVETENLFDVRLARAASRMGARYVMLSSRKVYDATRQAGAGEDAPTGPSDAYGRNKLRAERAVLDIMGGRATVLRLANVIGWEPGRRSFMGMMLSGLGREGRVTLDVSPFVRRDFLPVESVAGIIADLVVRETGGILNVGSGIGTPVGHVALWLMEGAGRGELVVTSPFERDGFHLDVARLAGHLGRDPAALDLAEYCRALGRRLGTKGNRVAVE
ncbi:NAD-dependent epimerase/dehydratase family protein [Arenibaculum sp.]|uniref:NAD-dependent epimerase/dehydratase family protein n=1 Tax=Arenibaculum sp. TaxID=2865862 RepID=UPI002E14A807|nr:sugar nucleotide-binding protein [Arenibaculum sp.]